MIKRHKELKVVTPELRRVVDKYSYTPKSGGHVGKVFGTMKIISYVKFKNIKMILSCSSCDKLYYTSITADDKQPLLTDCQCHNEGIDKSVKLAFHNKKLVKGDNEYWCTGCESYRAEHERAGRYCDVCNYITTNKITVYETFDQIMDRWEPTTHKPCTKKLPYLSGTSGKGFKIKGFTYVSSEDYTWCSKLHWIKAKNYIKATCSIANRGRVTQDIKELYGNCMFIHRCILGLYMNDKLLGDHINNLTLDNRKCNLRVATIIQNSSNTRPAKGKKSKYKGVDFLEGLNKPWRSRLYLEGKHKTATFYTEEEAAMDYNEMLDLYRPSEYNVYNKID